MNNRLTVRPIEQQYRAEVNNGGCDGKLAVLKGDLFVLNEDKFNVHVTLKLRCSLKRTGD